MDKVRDKERDMSNAPIAKDWVVGWRFLACSGSLRPSQVILHAHHPRNLAGAKVTSRCQFVVQCELKSSNITLMYARISSLPASQKQCYRLGGHSLITRQSQPEPNASKAQVGIWRKDLYTFLNPASSARPLLLSISSLKRNHLKSEVTLPCQIRYFDLRHPVSWNLGVYCHLKLIYVWVYKVAYPAIWELEASDPRCPSQPDMYEMWSYIHKIQKV